MALQFDQQPATVEEVGRDDRLSMRFVVAGVLALSVVAAACASDANETTRSSMAPARPNAVVVDGFPLGVYGVGAADGIVAGGAYTEFYEDGTGRVLGQFGNSSSSLGLHESGFTYVVDGDQIAVTATTGDCEAGATGTYRWTVEASMLRLNAPVDLCGPRQVAMHGDWYPLEDTPIVEVDPGGDPVTIDSPIGPIEFHVVAGQAYAWALSPDLNQFRSPSRMVTAIDGGFVAVVDEQPGLPTIQDQPGVADRALVFSGNGVDWRSIPSPPSTVGWIAVDRDQLFVAPARAPDAVYVSADRGDTWTALDVDDPPESISGLYAGPAGVVLTGPDAPLWLLDGESFRKVVSTPAPFVQVHVLDTGFFALSVDGDGDEPERAIRSYWRSDDGRTWTETTGVPADIYDRDTTSWGNSVYLSNWSEGIGYTSSDGGLTWSKPMTRPGENLAVTDAGYFSVQPAIFGPAVGVVWVSSDGVDWRRVLNPWPPLWVFEPVISGDMILVPSEIDPPSGEQAYLDWVGYIEPQVVE